MIATSRMIRLVVYLVLSVGAIWTIGHTSTQAVQIRAVEPMEDDQPPPKKDTGELTGLFTLPIDQKAQDTIDAIVRDYLTKKNPEWTKICQSLQPLLDSSETGMVELKTFDSSGAEIKNEKLSTRLAVSRLIGGMAKEGRDEYQRLYGAQAETLLRQGMDKVDPVLLREASQRYLHTRAGKAATVLLGTYYLDRGQVQRSAQVFKKLLALPDRDKLGPTTLFKAALALTRAGEKEYANQLWQEVKKLAAARGAIEFSPKQVISLDDLEPLLKQPLQRYATTAFSDDWAMFRGNVVRNASVTGGVPFMEPTFTKSMIPDDVLTLRTNGSENAGLAETTNAKATIEWVQNALDMCLRMLADRPLAVLPGFFPIATRDILVYRNYYGIFAVAARDIQDGKETIKAGEMLWYKNDQFSLLAMAMDAKGRNELDGKWWKPTYVHNGSGTSGPLDLFFANTLLGTMSHDGKYVYYIDDLAIPPHPALIQQYGGNLLNFGNLFQDAVRYNQLKAVEIETGKLVWFIGKHITNDKDVEANSIFADAHFLGAPLPLNGLIYVLIEKKGQLRLVCIDPKRKSEGKADGMIVWSLILGSPSTQVAIDMPRRIQAVHLAYSDGILIVPTNAGVVFGIDIDSQDIVWVRPYREASEVAVLEQNDLMLNGRIARGRIVQPGGQGTNLPAMNLNAERWRGGGPVVANGKLYFTAYDSPSLMCINIGTGGVIWSIPRTRPEDLYLAGVHGKNVVLVGRDYVRSIDADDGQTERWKIATGNPSGHSAIANGNLYLPIRSAPVSKEPEVWVIEIDTGRIIAQTKSRKKYEPGNLIFHNGDLYSQGPRYVQAFPQLAVKLEEMNRRLAGDPNDPLGLTERGELCLDQGRLEDAVKDLRTALKSNPTKEIADKARLKLYEALTELLQRRFEKGEQYLAEYEELCRMEGMDESTPEVEKKLKDERMRRRSMYQQLVARGREAQGRLVDAFENYLAFGMLHGNQELVSIVEDASTLVRAEVWARSRIEGMLDRARAEDRIPLQDRIAKEWDRTQAKPDLEKLRAFVRIFGRRLKEGRAARLLLAESLMKQRNEAAYQEAELILASLRETREIDPEITAQALFTEAQLMIDRNQLKDAVSLLVELGRDFPDIRLRDSKTGKDYFENLVTDKRFLSYLEKAGNMLAGRIRVSDALSQNGMIPYTFRIEPIGNPDGLVERHVFELDLNPSNSNGQFWYLRMIDRMNGEEYWRSEQLSPISGLTQFQQTLSGLLHVQGHIILLNQVNTVSAYNLSTKKKLWSKNIFGKVSHTDYQSPQVKVDALGISFVYGDGWVTRVGQSMLLRSTYACLNTRDGLVAVDPLNGNVLWTKSGVSSKAILYGDEDYIYLLEIGMGQQSVLSQVIRADDGVAVSVKECSELFKDIKRYRFYGRHILHLDEHDNRLSRLHFYDIVTGRDAWSLDIPKGSRLIAGENSTLAGYLTSEGEILLYEPHKNVEAHKVRLDAGKINEHLSGVTELKLLVDKYRFYVALNRRVDPGISLSQGIQTGVKVISINGPIYCFDRSTNKRIWFIDGIFENQFILLDHFHELSSIIGLVQFTKFNPQTGTMEGTGLRCVIIEKHSGYIRYRREFSQNNQQFKVNVQEDTVDLVRNDFRIKIQIDRISTR